MATVKEESGLQSQEWLNGCQRTLVKAVMVSCKISIPYNNQEQLAEFMDPLG